MDTLIWGGTGQAKVLRPIIERDGHQIVAVYDRDSSIPPPFPGVRLYSSESDVIELASGYGPPPLAFAVAIGGANGKERVKVGSSLLSRGLEPLSLVHERAWVAESASMAEGCQILAMAAVSEDATLGRFCIVNTNASVDHDCYLGEGVHVMPGATIAGCVRIGDFAAIGSNATILPRVTIGARAVIGAGAVVTRNVSDGATVAGVPARCRRGGSAEG